MPVPIAPLLGLAIGAALAIATGAPAESERPRAIALVGLFAVLVFAPACAVPLVLAEDWAFAYLVDGADVPSAIELVLVATDAAALVAGYAWASDPVRSTSRREAALLAGVPAALAVVVAAVLARAWRVDGTYHEVQGGFGTEPVVGGRLGYVLAWTLAVVVAGAAFTAHRLRAHRSGSDAPRPRRAGPPGRGLGARAGDPPRPARG